MYWNTNDYRARKQLRAQRKAAALAAPAPAPRLDHIAAYLAGRPISQQYAQELSRFSHMTDEIVRRASMTPAERKAETDAFLKQLAAFQQPDLTNIVPFPSTRDRP
jgi:hypothetical protein